MLAGRKRQATLTPARSTLPSMAADSLTSHVAIAHHPTWNEERPVIPTGTQPMDDCNGPRRQPCTLDTALTLVRLWHIFPLSKAQNVQATMHIINIAYRYSVRTYILHDVQYVHKATTKLHSYGQLRYSNFMLVSCTYPTPPRGLSPDGAPTPATTGLY